MARQWQQLSLEEAKRHPLYGIKNWLAVFAFGVLVSPIRSVGQLSNAARDAGLTLSQVLNSNSQIATFIKAGLAFDLALPALLLWLLFSKNQHFRVTAIAVLIFQWPAYLFVAYITGGTQIPGVVDAFFLQFLSSLLLNAVWVAYLQRSRRVRVTFENCVVVDKIGTSATYCASRPPVATKTTAGNEAYAEALAEIEEQRVHKGTWAQCFAEADGDESRTKASYIRKRADVLEGAAAWVDTQSPGLDGISGVQARAEVPSGGNTPKSKNSRFVWGDIAVACVVLALFFQGYQSYTKDKAFPTGSAQAHAPTQIAYGVNDTPAPPVDWSKGEIFGPDGKPVDHPQWESYVQKVHGLEAAAKRGEIPLTVGASSFEQPANSSQLPNAEANALESSQTWWRNKNGDEFHIHLKNATSSSLVGLGIEYSESDCGSNGGRIRFFVTPSRPIDSGSQSIIQFKVDLPVPKQTNNCLVIVSAWR